MSNGERWLYLGAFANFLLFLGISLWLGGDAAQGRAAGGEYWLGYKGRQWPVSAFVYHFSALHMMSLFFTHPLGMFVAWRARRRVNDQRNGFKAD